MLERKIGISVVIPLYNKEGFIERSVSSVLSQSVRPEEIIVVDDGSTDDSCERLTRWLTENNHQHSVRIIRSENKGVSVARNIGLSNCRYDYVAFLDADDVWQDRFIEELRLLIFQHPECVAFASAHSIQKKGVISEHLAPDSELVRFFTGEKFFEAMARYSLVNSSKIIVRKDQLERIGGFPPGIKYGEDLFVWIKLMQYSNLCFVNKSLVLINQEYDEGRAARNKHTLYPLVYFSVNQDEISNGLRGYLKSLFLKSLLVKLCGSNYGAALSTIRAYNKINGYRSVSYYFLLIFPSFVFRQIYKILKAI